MNIKEVLDERVIRHRLELAIKNKGEEHAEVALCHLDLGDFFELKLSYKEAEREYKKAANIFEQLGLDHELLLAFAIKSAAEMALMQGKRDEAGLLKGEARQLVKAYCNRDFGLGYDGDAA